ncbi:MAG TPA: putative metal-binding motif-containing protein, partial [Polyangiaceae bacterium]|nr:putative metal-binding motif-containing protein [Polyangiaceae bacterium]
MNQRRPARTLVAAALVLVATSRCGSRTTTSAIEGPPECTRDEDCDGAGDRCLPVQCTRGACEQRAPVNCDDKNACTSDVCDPATGACSHPDATVDLDHDGHRAPFPGKVAGEAGACGDDCDDRNAAAFPGGTEEPDSSDNDCNGIVDDGSTLVPSGEAVLVSEGLAVPEPSALAFANGNYIAAFNAELEKRTAIFLMPLTRTGSRAGPPSQLGANPADVTGGSLVWIGDRFGIAWSDRREARGPTLNFEAYFNVLNADRTKRMADARISRADGFSLGATVVFTGLEFVVLWQDDGQNAFGIDELYAQRVDREGVLVGDNVKMANEGPQVQTAPAIATGRRSLGVAWVRGNAVEGSHRVVFAPFDFQLGALAPTAVLSGSMTSAVYPTIVQSASQYVVAWYEDPPGPMIFGAVRDELGQDAIAAKVLTLGHRHARSP